MRPMTQDDAGSPVFLLSASDTLVSNGISADSSGRRILRSPDGYT